MNDTVEIVRLAHGGDGVTADGLFVPYTVPGDVVRLAHDGAEPRMLELLQSGPWRVAPACKHFGRCGGCALQHVAHGPYLEWKREQIVNALSQRGFRDVPVDAVIAVPPATRRRAMFKAVATKAGIGLGFYEPASRVLVDIEECPILVPALAKLIAPLRAGLRGILKPGETAELHATALDAGIDLSLRLKRAREPDLLMQLGELAGRLKLARLSFNGEPVTVAEQPVLRVARFGVKLPVEAFLQPTVEGERALQERVRAAVGTAKRIADLFCGCGTFALALADEREVHAFDFGASMIEALATAAKDGRAKVHAERRDLFRQPLLPGELHMFDAVVLDPPRPGAKAQAEQLAQSGVPRIVYVSCSPASFARDARILCNGGYRLAQVTPLDQFLWSPHVELVAVFERR